MNHLVSVVIPACDRVAELACTLQSVLNQSYEKLEVLVIENNSLRPEKIHSLVAGFKDSRFSSYTLENCQNANVARNYGVKLAKGRYVAFLDSDDIWQTHHISESVELLEKNNFDFTYSGAFIDNGYKKIKKIARNLHQNEKAIDYIVGFKGGYAQTSSYVVSKKVCELLQWDETLKRNQDLDYFVRAVNAFNVVVNPKINVLINWEKGVVRNYHFSSMCKFYAKNSLDMKKTTSIRYCLIGIRQALQNKKFKDASKFVYFAIIKVLFNK